MNSFQLIDVEYIRPDRTIEIILVKPQDRNEKLVYLYNDHGIHFRIFPSFIELSNFLQGQKYEILAEFESERRVENFLFTLTIQ